MHCKMHWTSRWHSSRGWGYYYTVHSGTFEPNSFSDFHIWYWIVLTPLFSHPKDGGCHTKETKMDNEFESVWWMQIGNQYRFLNFFPIWLNNSASITYTDEKISCIYTFWDHDAWVKEFHHLSSINRISSILGLLFENARMKTAPLKSAGAKDLVYFSL